ncbi:MAG: response regulator transcription factor [Bacteroidota bacterium]|nr:response regulator transcription factor [Bacteroidota bacterium]
MTILLVDDNTKFRAFVKKMLQSSIYNLEAIYECEDGESAISMFSALKPDWVLMDIKLPNIDGLEATCLIREKNRDAKIIILTQYNDTEYREVATKFGASNFFLKENVELIPKILNNNN